MADITMLLDLSVFVAIIGSGTCHAPSLFPRIDQVGSPSLYLLYCYKACLVATPADQVFFSQPRSTSVANFWGFTQGKKTDDDLKEAMGNWVDVSGPAVGSKSQRN
jgi:hypothetical protein